MEASESYQVRLEVFEGPLDLLLFLIRKKKIDINDIPIAAITREYLEYLTPKERINLDREAEFLLMAAYLIHIKSQMLLPREVPVEEAEDPRRRLVDQLLEYQKIKAACGLLREREEEQLQNWTRTILPTYAQPEDLDLIEVSLFDLAESFFLLMKQKEGDIFRVIQGKEVSLEKKTKEILTILEQNSYLDFLEYLDKQETLEEALVSFFCLLELIKAKLVMAIQEQLFHTIKVWRRKDAKVREP